MILFAAIKFLVILFISQGFSVGNLVFKQVLTQDKKVKIGISMGMILPIWGQSFPTFLRIKVYQTFSFSWVKRAYKYQETGRFIESLRAINDGNDFGNSCKYIILIRISGNIP